VLNQELIVEAALTGDRKLALQALLNDPLVRDFRTAPRMLDELLAAHADYLPQF
jgi:6-phospho-beta-glucosidase